MTEHCSFFFLVSFLKRNPSYIDLSSQNINIVDDHHNIIHENCWGRCRDSYYILIYILCHSKYLFIYKAYIMHLKYVFICLFDNLFI